MVKMTLTDKGTYDLAGSFPSTGTEEKAYGSAGTVGTALNMNIYTIEIEDNTLINTEPEAQKKESDDQNKRFEVGETDKNGIEFPVWKLKGVVDVDDTDGLKDFGRLRHMMKTKGYKTLGYAGGGSNTPDIFTYSLYGQKEFDADGTKTITSLNVRLQKLKSKQIVDEGTKIEYTLELVEVYTD